MSIELTIKPLNLATVAFNKDELAAAIMTITERYTGLVVTDKAEAKRDRAEVNRILKQIDEVRKIVKKQYEEPLKAFESDLKAIVAPLKEAAAAIDQQIKAIEETERTKRMEALKAIYASTTCSAPFSRVFDDKWLNTSISEKKAAEGLIAAINAAGADLNVIRASNSDNIAALIDKYNNGATLAEVLEYSAQLKQMAQKFVINGTETPEEIVAELNIENPRNNYVVTDDGIQVVGKPELRIIKVACTDGQLWELASLMKQMGVFYIVE